MDNQLDLDRFVDDVRSANREQEAQRAVDDVLARTVSHPARVLAGLGEPRASIGIYTGREDNIIWEQKGSAVKAARAASLSEKEVFPLPKDAIHSVTNPIRRLTGAIHVYGGDFFVTAGRSEWDPETLSQRPFDLEAARANFREASARFDSGR
jgi:hypothetical protein